MPKLIRRTTTQIVSDEIRQRILAGQLKEGEQIRQEAIASELGVSRIPVREALRQLEAEGLVTLVSHKGAEVTRLEPAEIAELFEIRMMLEARLLELAMPNITEANLQAAQDLINAMCDDAEIQEWGSLNWQFHETLYRPAQRSVTMKILRQIHQNIDRYVRLQITLTKDGKAQAHHEHSALLDAVRKAEVKKAVVLLTGHIDHVQQELLANISES